jgi:hypothetical protein
MLIIILFFLGGVARAIYLETQIRWLNEISALTGTLIFIAILAYYISLFRQRNFWFPIYKRVFRLVLLIILIILLLVSIYLTIYVYASSV